MEKRREEESEARCNSPPTEYGVVAASATVAPVAVVAESWDGLAPETRQSRGTYADALEGAQCRCRCRRREKARQLPGQGRADGGRNEGGTKGQRRQVGHSTGWHAEEGRNTEEITATSLSDRKSLNKHRTEYGVLTLHYQ